MDIMGMVLSALVAVPIHLYWPNSTARVTTMPPWPPKPLLAIHLADVSKYWFKIKISLCVKNKMYQHKCWKSAKKYGKKCTVLVHGHGGDTLKKSYRNIIILYWKGLLRWNKSVYFSIFLHPCKLVRFLQHKNNALYFCF